VVRYVLEVGCGAGRDGLVLADGGCAYTGIDLSPAAVRICREQGLHALEASATDLPLADASFDAAWSMSTLMHLPGSGFDEAIGELGRVMKPGGPVAIGVWGHTRSGERTKPDGRYFRHRSDEELQAALRVLGEVVAFETWDWFDDGGHYQFARVVAR
jgi:SAM-dependent methyltransferase